MIMMIIGYTVNVYSVKGGKIPFDGGSLTGDFFTSDCKKFKEDGLEEKLCSASAPVTAIDVSSSDALYIPGGHACYGDMLDEAVTNIINQFVAAGKVVAADCHGTNTYLLIPPCHYYDVSIPLFYSCLSHVDCYFLSCSLLTCL